MAASFQVSAPEPFTFSRPDEWPKWIRRFERFRVASGLSEKDDKTQVNTLIYAMGDQADDILSSFSLSADDSKKYTPVKAKFDGHFVKRRNVIYERTRFNMRRQQEGEAADSFITSLYSLAEHCQYGALHDEMIRDRIVVGIRNTSLSERMQLQPDLDLEKAVTQVRQAEAIKQQQPLLRSGSVGKPDTPVDTVHQGRTWQRPRPGPKSRQNTRATHTSQPGEGSACPRCGKLPTHDRLHCPARDSTCHKCGKKGHFQAVCRSARVSHVDVGNTSSGGDTDVFLATVEDPVSAGSDPWTADITVNGTLLELLIDTGAEVTVMSELEWAKAGKPALSQPDRMLRGPSARKLSTIGKFSAELSTDNRTATDEVYVVRGLHKSLLGRPAIEKLRLLCRLSLVEATPQMAAQAFSHLFVGLGKLTGDYCIRLQEGARPYALSTPRRVAIPLMKEVEQELQRMEGLGVITIVQEPTEWCAGMVVVPKANGKVRMCRPDQTK